MRVFRTVTIANSADTKNPLAKTSAVMPASRHRTPASDGSITVLRESLYQMPPRRHEDHEELIFDGKNLVFFEEKNFVFFVTSWLRFSVRKKVCVDEVVDDRLVRRIDVLELDAHADAPIAPRDLAFRVDVPLRSGHAEKDLDFRHAVERAGGPAGDAAVSQVVRQ